MSAKRLLTIGALLLVTGCAPLPTFRNPFDGPVPAYKSQYGPTPAERVERLRMLAETASSMTPEQQATACTELAATYDSERDPIIRRQLVRTLGGFTTAAALPVLHRATEDSDFRIRQAAAEAWGRRPGSESTSALSGLFANDSDANVRLEACRSLGKFKSLDAIQQLANGLNDRNPAIQYASIQSLKSSTGETLGNDVNDWIDYVAKLTNSQNSPLSGADAVMLAQPPASAGSMTR